jgi:hypothetical protein
MAIRSGRFRAKITNVTQGITIIKGRKGAFYRIFNSGEKSFTVKHGGTDVPLHPTFSIDVATKSATGNVIIAAIAANDVVEGIYDYLDIRNPRIRSGRFNSIKHPDVSGAPFDPTTQHPIIDFAGGTLTGWYRIFNSGDNTITLEVNSATPSTVEKEQSLDFAVTGDRITVKSAATGEHIECIYEFLGQTK